MNIKTKNSGIDWIGDIPVDWDVVKLKYIFNIKNGYAFSKVDYAEKNNGNYLIKISQITENGIRKDNADCIKVNETSKQFKIQEDSILYALSGATAGKCCYLGKENKNYYLNQNVVQISLKNGINKYLYYLLSNKTVSKIILNLSSNTVQPNINKRDLNNFYIPFTSNVNKQRQIVDYLDNKTSNIEKRISLLKKKDKLLEEYKEALIYKAVTNGLNKNVKMKDSGISWIGDIPVDWDVVKIKNCTEYKVGFTINKKDLDLYQGNFSWVNIIDLKDKIVTKSKNQVDEIFFSEKKKIPAGSLLFSFKSSIGKVAFNSNDVFTSEAILSFLKSSKINLNYLFYAAPLLISQNANFDKNGSQVLDQELIKNSYILYPPIVKQQQIANYLDSKLNQINKNQELVMKQISLLEEYKQSLIYEVVTGKKSINQEWVIKNNLERKKSSKI